MSEEEKEELDNLVYLLEIHHIGSNILFKMKNLIQKQQEEYKDLKLKYEQNLSMCKHWRNETNKKDKIIDLMTNRFQQICVSPLLAKYQWKRICSEDLNKCEGHLCEDCIKQYFENLAEEK